MIYRFTIISDEVEDFMREIKIDSDATFLDLHQLIIESCGYNDDQLTSFTICEDGWEKGQEITMEVMDTDSYEDSFIMAETELSEFLEDEKQHLLYTFDPLADRVFFMELSEIITGKSMTGGMVTKKFGDAPQQMLDFDDMLNMNPVGGADIFDEDDAFDDGYDQEDIDIAGLEISDGEF